MLIFAKTLFAIFFAEMGDKTQLLLLALAKKYKVSQIVIGTALSICVLNFIAVALGSMLNQYLPIPLIKFVAGIAFFVFAWQTACGKDKDESEAESRPRRKIPAFLTIAGIFFIAELGDKTQLTALAFSAEGGISEAVPIFFACTIGLMAADMIGLVVGLFLGAKLPENVLRYISFAIFAVFGVLVIYEAAAMQFPDGIFLPIAAAAASALLFAGSIILGLIHKKRAR